MIPYIDIEGNKRCAAFNFSELCDMAEKLHQACNEIEAKNRSLAHRLDELAEQFAAMALIGMPKKNNYENFAKWSGLVKIASKKNALEMLLSYREFYPNEKWDRLENIINSSYNDKF